MQPIKESPARRISESKHYRSFDVETMWLEFARLRQRATELGIRWVGDQPIELVKRPSRNAIERLRDAIDAAESVSA